MGKPIFCAESLFNTVQYPSHTVTANEAASGHEAFRVANGRRSALDYWSPTTANAAAWVKVTCNRVRAADIIALDRGHNLAGKTVRLQVSLDDFATTPREVFAVTIPSTPGGSLDGSLGCVTEEGAWLKRFNVEAGMQWRLYVDAMGSGLVPRLVGLWLGLAWESEEYADKPWGDDTADLAYAGLTSDAGWVGVSSVSHARAGEVGIRLGSELKYDRARFHLQANYHNRRRPMWYVPDSEQADRAMLVVPPPGRLGFAVESGNWAWRQARIPYIEHEPKP